MKEEPRYVSIVIHRDGEIESRSFRLPVRAYTAAKWSIAAFLVLVVVGAALYAPVVRTAARVPGMNREISRLSAENEQVRQLAATLGELEERYSQVRSALGADVIPEVGSDSGLAIAAVAVQAKTPLHPDFPAGPTLPTYWPLDTLFETGVMTRGFAAGDGARDVHTGVDIAVRSGTPILAAGGGKVSEAAFDPEYGWFVLIDHPQRYQSMYGHASRLLVSPGDSVSAGQIIALAGNTGRSTAPHLHFEKRRDGQLIDPLVPLTPTTER